MTPQSRLLFYGEGSGANVQRLQQACAAQGIEETTVSSWRTALARLQASPSPLLVDASVHDAPDLVAQMHADRALATLPIAALVDDARADQLIRPFRWGVEEALRTDELSRLRPLVDALAAPVERAEPQGAALVAFASPTDRRMRARSLLQAGFSVRFVSSAEELPWCFDDGDFKLIIAESALLGDPDNFRRLRAIDPRRRAWVVVAPTVEVSRWSRGCRDANAVVLSRDAPPDNALYAGHGILRAQDAELRASPRVLHAGVVRYSVEGRTETSHGISFNISREGVYVRAIAPPPRGTRLWIEVAPPGDPLCVHLEAVVAWSRPYGSTRFLSSPPGFGAAFTDGTVASKSRWALGYEHALRER